MKLLLSNWGGFTELHILNTGSVINWSSVSAVIDPLPSKTNSDLALKSQTMEILLSMIVSHRLFDNSPLKNIKSKADEISKFFSELPNNIESDSSNLDPYVSHLNPFANMTNSKTGLPYGRDDYYILALMLINEALRLKGETSIAPAIEATKVCSIADLHWWRDGFKQESIKKLTGARHWKSRIVREYTELLAKAMKGNNPDFNGRRIAKEIKDQVFQKADEVGFNYSKLSFPETIYRWVLAILKN